MIGTEQWMDIKALHRQGLSQRQIARQTGHSRNTVSKVLGQGSPEPMRKRERPSCLDPYKPYLTQRWQCYQLRAPRLLEEIRAQGYSGSINLVQRFLRTLRQEQTLQKRATVRFETAPGQQAQADWAEVGRDEQGKKLYAFVMVLSFSRMLFVAFTRSMKTEELIRCHQSAFSYFGGVPASVLLDNMAQVKLPGSSGSWNPLFQDFALHYGFTVRTHRPYRPRTKGKVERMVEFLKDNFLRGRSFASFEDLAHQGHIWQEEANARIHATTGERPRDLLARETLAPLSALRPYTLAQRQERRVDVEGFVRAGHVRYSVPPPYVGKRVVVVLGEQSVQVRLGETLVAEHRRGAPGDCVAAKEHVEAMWKETLERSAAEPPPRAAGARVEFPAAQEAQEGGAAPPLSFYDQVAELSDLAEMATDLSGTEVRP